MLIVFNGDMVPDDHTRLLNNNRAFLYGDGFFESMRWQKDRVLYFSDHIERIKNACYILKMKLPIDERFLNERIKNLISENKIASPARIRLTVFRESAGAYLPLGNGVHYMMTAGALNDDQYVFNEQGLNVDFYTEQTKTSSSISNIKSLNSLVSVLASLYAKEKQLDDALLINNHQKVIEGTGTNLFIIKNNSILTPLLTDGCVNGVMRKQLHVIATRLELNWSERSLSIEDVLNADEVFLTNVVNGIRWVKQIREKNFRNETAKKIFALLRNI